MNRYKEYKQLREKGYNAIMAFIYTSDLLKRKERSQWWQKKIAECCYFEDFTELELEIDGFEISISVDYDDYCDYSHIGKFTDQWEEGAIIHDVRNEYDEPKYFVPMYTYDYERKQNRKKMCKHDAHVKALQSVKQQYETALKITSDGECVITVVASKRVLERSHEVKLGTSVLGGCSWNDIGETILEYEMVEKAIEQAKEAIMNSNKWIILDWANNHLFPDKTFDDFEDAWCFIYSNVPDEGNSTYDDYFVVREDDYKPNFMDKTDLTEYADNELLLHVLNNEYLYNRRYKLTKDELEEMFVFTQTQWEELEQDIEDEMRQEGML